MDYSFDTFGSNFSMSEFNNAEQAIYYNSDFDGTLYYEEDENFMEPAYSKPSSIAVEQVRQRQQYETIEQQFDHGDKTIISKNTTYKSNEAMLLLLQQYFANKEGFRFHVDENTQGWTLLYVLGAQYCAFRLWLENNSSSDCQVVKTMLEGSREVFSHIGDELSDTLSGSAFGSLMGSLNNDQKNKNKMSNYDFYNQEQNLVVIDSQLQIIIQETRFSPAWADALQIICDLCADKTIFPLLQSRGAVRVLSAVLACLATGDADQLLREVSIENWRHCVCCVLSALSNMSVHMSSLIDMVQSDALLPALVTIYQQPSKPAHVNVPSPQTYQLPQEQRELEQERILHNLVRDHLHQCSKAILLAMKSTFDLSTKYPTLMELLNQITVPVESIAHNSNSFSTAGSTQFVTSQQSNMNVNIYGARKRATSNTPKFEVSAKGELISIVPTHISQPMAGLC